MEESTHVEITPASVAAMSDRELDILLAELITGQPRFTCRQDPIQRDGEPQFHWGYPHGHDFAPAYSTDPAAAAEAVAAALAKGCFIVVSGHTGDWEVTIGARDPNSMMLKVAQASTEPRAKAECCALALAAMSDAK